MPNLEAMLEKKARAKVKHQQQPPPKPPTKPPADQTAQQLMLESMTPVAPTPEPDDGPFDTHPSHGLTTPQWVLLQLTLGAMSCAGSAEYAVTDTNRRFGILKILAREIVAFEGAAP